MFQQLVMDHVATHNTALYCDGRMHSYRDLSVLTSRCCSWLQRHDIRKGQIVVLAICDSLDFVVTFLSCVRLGIIVSPVDPQLSLDEWREILSEVNPRWILATEYLSQTLNDHRTLTIAHDHSSGYFLSLLSKEPESNACEAVEPHEPALIIYTSGTTGTPKGVVHTYQSLGVDNFARTVLRMTDQDLVLSCARLHTSFGLNTSLLFPLRCGAGVILSRNVPNPTSLQNMLALRPTLFFAVPSIYELLLGYQDELRQPLQCVRLCVAAGDTLYGDVLTRWTHAYSAPLLEGFGSSEMKHIFISNRGGISKPHSCGTVVEGFEVAFSRDGRMRYRGPSLSCGYYADEALTRARFVDGWFRSDDLGYMDDDGYVFIQGRANLVWKSHGQWVSMREVERVLRQCPLVKEVMVLPTRTGLAYHIALQEDGNREMAERAIRRYGMQHLKLHELPRTIHIVNAIPKTRRGKIDRQHVGA